MSKSQVGARFIYRERFKTFEPAETSAPKKGGKEVIKLPSGVLKRKRG